MDLISVIVTVQAGGRALSRCINSVLNQSYYEVQLVLVVNGATDDSMAICTEYAKRDSRVKVVQLERQSLKAARTAGLRVAFGEYVAFLNGQDALDFYALQRMHACLKNSKGQLCICGVKYVEDNQKLLYWEGPRRSRVCGMEEFHRKLMEVQPHQASDAAENKKFFKLHRSPSYWTREENKLYWMGLFDDMVVPGGQGLEKDSPLACVQDRLDRIVLNPHRLYHHHVKEEASLQGGGYYNPSLPINGRIKLLRSVLAQMCWIFMGWITVKIMK